MNTNKNKIPNDLHVNINKDFRRLVTIYKMLSRVKIINKATKPSA
jgi:hypothetical protein